MRPRSERRARFLRSIILPSLLLLAAGCGEAPASADRPAQPTGASTLLQPQGFVTDAAGLLDAPTKQRLTDRLKALEKATGHQLVIVTTPSLEGQDILFYAVDLGRRWGIGRKGHDDGVIVLVAPRERKVRITVGYGLESTLTDPRCAEIIQRDMIPAFTKGDYAGGLERAVDSLVARLRPA